VDPAVNCLSLFSGAAGLDLGVALAFGDVRVIAYVEREAYACEVLASRMEKEDLDPAPIWTDVSTFDGRPFRGLVDIISGGFPCQDISVAGKQEGIGGKRSGLWKQYLRIVDEVRPGLVIIENVSALVTKGLEVVLYDLASLGYDAAWGTLRASDVGATHRRDRIFIVALADDDDAGLDRQWLARIRLSEQEHGEAALRRHNTYGQGGSSVADAASNGRRQRWTESDAERETSTGGAEQELAHGVGRGRGQLLGEREPELAGGEIATPRSSESEPQKHSWTAGHYPPPPQTRESGAKSPASDRTLNPRFVEWLMGWPIGWTDCDSQVTEWFLLRPLTRSDNFSVAS
jgi:DNA (cytosine-5)-methyltransferase 1